jgi:hypothetical protein
MRTDRLCFAVLFFAFCVSSMFAQSAAMGGAANSTPQAAKQCQEAALPNANQLALLRWYGANTVNTIPTGGAPNGIAFDGANIWVVAGPTNSVTKLRANDGALLG